MWPKKTSCKNIFSLGPSPNDQYWRHSVQLKGVSSLKHKVKNLEHIFNIFSTSLFICQVFFIFSFYWHFNLSSIIFHLTFWMTLTQPVVCCRLKHPGLITLQFHFIHILTSIVSQLEMKVVAPSLGWHILIKSVTNSETDFCFQRVLSKSVNDWYTLGFLNFTLRGLFCRSSKRVLNPLHI